MISRTVTVGVLSAMILMGVSGCKTNCKCGERLEDIKTATQMQHERMDYLREYGRPYLAYQVDNAIHHDMSLADIHFVPHTAELSSTGTVRLERMAKMLDAYGGNVRYETFIVDQQLIDARLAHVREYLELIGCDVSRVDVTTGLSGGRGMSATRAIEAYEKAMSDGDDAAASNSNPLSASGGGPSAPF